jgi:hypothetical protein
VTTATAQTAPSSRESFTSAGNGHYIITNVNSGTVLDALDCETANGTVVRQWAQLDNTSQQRDITP